MRKLLVVLYPGLQSLDVSGPVEVFAAAAATASGAYSIELASLDGQPVQTSSGISLGAHRSLADVAESVDTLLVPGGEGTARALSEPALLAQVRRLAGGARRVASVCTGAFLLAELGLLDGHRATTHWLACEQLARRYPAVEVLAEPIFVRAGRIYTSAGVTAGLDLALALIEEDLGSEIALDVARRLVLFLRRPAGQSQFSAQLTAQLADRRALRDLQQWISDHPEADLSVESLAGQANLSPRHFARIFREQTGVTPARYVEGIRLEAARRRLEESSDPIELIAHSCGFGSAETLRRTLHRRLGVSPAEYRRRFAAPLALSA